MDAFAKLSGAAHSGAAGLNGYPEPTGAQARSGNYRKGRVTLHDLPIAIETPQGLRRTGKANGDLWSVICHAHYGYFEKTRGADGDAIDVFVGPWPEAETVYVVNRMRKDGGFDEHKVLMGFTDRDSAVTCYQNSYESGQSGLGSVITCSIDQLKWWIKFGDHRQPLTDNQLPHDGNTAMNDIAWDSAANPVGTTLASVLYSLRRNDAAEGLMLDAVTVQDVLEDADGEEVLDALVVPLNKLERKLGQMQVIMRAASKDVRPMAMQVTPPFKQRGTTNVAGIFELSDGQSITAFFHNPDSTPNRLTPDDEMVSWKWMLNKKDVTIVVAPERGRELNPREVARRLMRLAEANSSRFQAANAKRSERMAAIEQGRITVESKQRELDTLSAEIETLEARVEVKRSTPAATLQEADHVNRDNDNAVAGSVNDFDRKDMPGIMEVATAMTQASNGSTWWLDAGVNYVINKAAKAGWVNRPSTSQVNWTQAGLDALNAARGEAAAVLQRQENPGTLPPGWSEASPGGVATNRNPKNGGIIDKATGTGKWFVIFEDESIPKSDDEFATRAEAIAALEAALSARDAAEEAAAAAQPDSDIERALELIREAKGGVAQLGGSSFFTFDVDGDDAVFDDDMRAKVEALLGEKVKAVVLPGLEGQLSIVPASFNADAGAPDPTPDLLTEARAYLATVIDGSIDLAEPAVADRLTELYEAHNGNAEFDDLFGKAADAYQAFMVALAQKAL